MCIFHLTIIFLKLGFINKSILQLNMCFFPPQIRAIHNREDLSETKKTKLSQLDLFRISGID